MYIRCYGVKKRRSDRHLKSAASQYPSTSNMVKSAKHVLNHHGGTFIILIDHRSGY